MDDFNLGGFVTGGGLGDLLGAGLLGYGMSDYTNPASGAMDYMNQISPMLQKYFNPYMQAGQQALPQLQQQYGNLINNPTGVMNAIGGTFHASPGYNWEVSQAEQGVNHAASAGGMLGTPQEQQQMAQTVGNIANQNYYNYLGLGMNSYNRGLQGMQGLAGMGYGASSNLGEDLASALMSQAQLSYAGQADQNQEQQSSMGGIGSLIGSALSFL